MRVNGSILNYSKRLMPGFVPHYINANCKKLNNKLQGQK
jgi:hypothetical protein